MRQLTYLAALIAGFLLSSRFPVPDAGFKEIGKGKAMATDVENVAVSASGRYAAANAGGVFQLADTSGGFFDEWEFESRITGLCFLGEKAYLFKENGSVEVRDCKAGKFLSKERVPTPATFPMVASDGSKFYYVGPEPKGQTESGVACIDRASGRVDYYLPNSGTVGLYDVSADGKQVVTVDRLPDDGKGAVALRLRIYHVATKTWTKLRDTKSANDTGDLLTSCHFSPDGKTILAVVNSTDKEGVGNSSLVTYDAATGKMQRSIDFPEGMIGEAAFLPDGKNVVFQNGKDLFCYDLEARQPAFSVEVGAPSVLPFRIAANGSVLAMPAGKQVSMFRIAR